MIEVLKVRFEPRRPAFTRLAGIRRFQMWSVSQHGGVVDKERFRLVSPCKVEHEVVEHVRAIVVRRCWQVLAVSNQAGMPEATGLCAILPPRMLHALRQVVIVSPNQVLIEPGVSHERWELPAELPLTRLSCGVAFRLHHVRVSEMIGNVGLWRISLRLESWVLHAQKSIVKAILPRHQTDSSWSTQWHRVKRFDPCSLCCHVIQIGGLMLFAAVA